MYESYLKRNVMLLIKRIKNMMIDTKRTHGLNGNYNIYVCLEDKQLLEIILLSSLDDTINHLALTNRDMPEACRNIFGSVQFLYEYFQNYVWDSQRVFVSDIGSIQVVEFMERRGKSVKLQCQLSTNKIIDPVQTNKFYLKIIRQFIPSKQEYKQAIGCSQSKNQIQQKKLGAFSQHKKSESWMMIEQPMKFERLSSSKLSLASEPKGQKIVLTVDLASSKDCQFFQKFQQTIRIAGFSRSRLNLFFKQVIPKSSVVYFTIKVINLKTDALSVGLYDRNEIKSDKPSNYNYCFDYGKGQIKDSNNRKDQAETSWRHTKRVFPSNYKNALLTTEVNTKQQKLSFYCNGVLLMDTIISNYLMGKEMVPYINCKHMGDEFKINVV